MRAQVKPGGSPLVAGGVDAALSHDDIVSLTYEVRGFSEALAKLKLVFLPDDPGEWFASREMTRHPDRGDTGV